MSFGAPVAESRRFDAAASRDSLEQSLRALRVESVDWLFYHEATLDEANQPEAIDFFSDLKERELIRCAGIGGTVSDLQSNDDLSSSYDVVQSSIDLFCRAETLVHHRQISIYAVLHAVKALQGHLESSASIRKDWEDLLQAPLRGREALGCLVLRTTLLEFPDARIVFYSSNPDRIGRVVQAAREPASAIPLREKVKEVILGRFERSRSERKAAV